MPRPLTLTATPTLLAALRSLLPSLHKQRTVLLEVISRSKKELDQVENLIATVGRPASRAQPGKAVKKAKRRKRTPTQPLVLAALRRRASGANVASLVEATKLKRMQVHNALFQLVKGKKVTRNGENYLVA